MRLATSVVVLALAVGAPEPAVSLGAQGAAVVATPARGNTQGGFVPGDRILVVVEGERALSDTFTVRPGPQLELPVIGNISLAGVRRDELERYLQGAVGKFVKNPVVRARALVRFGVVGEVARPGFYALPADALVSDALTAAGGLTQSARVNAIHVERSGRSVGNDDMIRRAIARGATLGEAGIDPGDELVVPRARDAERTWRIIGIIVSIPAAIVAITLMRR